MKVAVLVVLHLGVLVLLHCVDASHVMLEGQLPSEMLMPVNLGKAQGEAKGLGREKRQAIAKTQPFRILPVYADSVNANLQEKAVLVQGTIIPRLLDFLHQSLSVAPLPGPILLNNRCTTSSVFKDATTGRISCVAQCAPTTTCGQFEVPQEHLKQCLQCNDIPIFSNCVVGSPAQDGVGVSDHDFILYITADQSACPQNDAGSAQTVAFASSCQNEVSQDRPVAGSINFCPDGVRSRDPDFAFAVAKHELLHAIVFSSSLFALWRDPETNNPRTPREASGLPMLINGMFQISNSTVDTTTYTDWVTSSGVITHQVTRLVTPAVRAEARRHFGCPSLEGVELENQGGSGSALQHWEKRVLGNEAMTSQLTFNPVFSPFTFAALEDSGWYSVNYSLADELVWGRDAGCRFAEGSCREWIDQQVSNGQLPAPFCELLESTSPTSLSCTADREAVSRCNRVGFVDDLPADFQFFSDPRSGGRVTFTDFCPIQDVFSFVSTGGTTRGTTCSVEGNLPPSNLLLEEYGPGSRCLTHGQQWTLNGQPVTVYGGGCYQFSCGDSQVTISIGGEDLVCTCSETGEERMVDIQQGATRFQGSIICPSCTSICHVPSRNIAAPIETPIPTTGGEPVTEEATVTEQATEPVSEATEPVSEATPISEEATEPVSEEATEPVTEETTESVTEEATEPVSEEATESVSEEATEPVSEEATESVTEEATESVSEEESVNEETTEPVTEETTEPVTEETTEPVTEETTEPETEESNSAQTLDLNSTIILFVLLSTISLVAF